MNSKLQEHMNYCIWMYTGYISIYCRERKNLPQLYWVAGMG